MLSSCLQSNYGTAFIPVVNESQWYFGLYPSHAIDYLDEAYIFYVPLGSSTSYEQGTCAAYAVTNETLSDIVGKLGMSTTLNVTVNETDIWNVTVVLPTFEIVENFTHSQQRRKYLFKLFIQMNLAFPRQRERESFFTVRKRLLIILIIAMLLKVSDKTMCNGIRWVSATLS